MSAATVQKVKSQVLLVDDEPEIRGSLVNLFEQDGLEFLHADNGSAALSIAQTQPLDAIVSDVRMPKMGGIEFITELRERGIQTPVIFLSAYADKDIAIKALRLGAVDFLEKPFTADQIRHALFRSLETASKGLRASLQRRGFTARQIEILEHVARGESNKDIANAVHLSEKGVKYHIGILLKEFNVTNRYELQIKLQELN